VAAQPGVDRLAASWPGPPALGAGDGQALLRELLSKAPAEVADWALRQAASLSEEAFATESSSAFQLAAALAEAPPEQRRSLLRAAVTGLGQLPAPRRAEVVRLSMQAMAAARPSAGGDSTGAPPLLRNALRLAQSARLEQLPAEELSSLAQEAQLAAERAGGPEALLGAVGELAAEERGRLAEALVEARMVPEEHRAAVEAAVRPGGYADRLAAGLRLLDLVCACKGLCTFAPPLLELLLAWAVGSLPCGAPLAGWLRVDALLTLAVAAAVWRVGDKLDPVYQKLRTNPMGSVQQWQQVAHESKDWRVRLEAAVPGVSLATYQAGGTAVVACFGLELLGTAWAAVGLLELVAATMLGCSGMVTAICAACVALRLTVTVVLLVAACSVQGHFQWRPALPPRAPERLASSRGAELGLLPGRSLARIAAPASAASTVAASGGGTPDVSSGPAPAPRATTALPTRGRDLHRQVANDHADLMERLAGLERGRGGQRER